MYLQECNIYTYRGGAVMFTAV